MGRGREWVVRGREGGGGRGGGGGVVESVPCKRMRVK